MYGKTMKEEFIEEYMRSRIIAKTSLYSLFKKTEPFEEELSKDCSRFSLVIVAATPNLYL